jgi:predicted acyltransferase (DUF342 family)
MLLLNDYVVCNELIVKNKRTVSNDLIAPEIKISVWTTMDIFYF